MHVNRGHDSESSFLSTYIHMMEKTTELDLERFLSAPILYFLQQSENASRIPSLSILVELSLSVSFRL